MQQQDSQKQPKSKQLKISSNVFNLNDMNQENSKVPQESNTGIATFTPQQPQQQQQFNQQNRQDIPQYQVSQQVQQPAQQPQKKSMNLKTNSFQPIQQEKVNKDQQNQIEVNNQQILNEIPLQIQKQQKLKMNKNIDSYQYQPTQQNLDQNIQIQALNEVGFSKQEQNSVIEIQNNTIEKQQLEEEKINQTLQNQQQEENFKNPLIQEQKEQLNEEILNKIFELIQEKRKLKPDKPEDFKNMHDIGDAIKEIGSRETREKQIPQYQKYQSKSPKQNFQQNASFQSPQFQQSQHSQQFIQLERQKLDPLYEKIKKEAGSWTKQNIQESDQNEIIKLTKEIKNNLNKLAPNNFETIKKEVIRISSKSVQLCQILAECIIEKSWTEKKYTSQYAQLCYSLIKEPSLFFNEKRNKFKIILIENIQIAFEKFEAHSKKKKKLTSEEKKTRVMGNINFIGHLYLQRVVSKQIILICTWTLIQKFYKALYKEVKNVKLQSQISFQQQQQIGEEKKDFYQDCIDAIIILYNQIGEKLETDTQQKLENDNQQKVKQKQQQFDSDTLPEETVQIKLFKNLIQNIIKFFNNQEELMPFSDGLMNKTNQKFVNLSVTGLFDIISFLQQIKCSSIIPNRIQCLLQNLIERRKNKWKSQTIDHGPTTIEEVHRKHQEEKQTIDMKAAEYYASQQKRQQNSSQKQKDVQIQKKQIYVYQQKDVPQDQNVQHHVNNEQVLSKKVILILNKYKQSIDSSYQIDKINDLDNELQEQEEKNFQQNIYTEDTFYEEMELLNVDNNNFKQILLEFFNNFYKSQEKFVRKMLFFPLKFFEKSNNSIQDFLQVFNDFLKSVYKDYEDNPNLKLYLGEIILDFIYNNHFTFQDINFQLNSNIKNYEDMWEQMKDFIQNLVEGCLIKLYKDVFIFKVLNNIILKFRRNYQKNIQTKLFLWQKNIKSMKILKQRFKNLLIN